MFNPGFQISVTHNPMNFTYGKGVFGPTPERRKLETIRTSLSDQNCSGPETVYCIAMDVGKCEHLDDLKQRHLLYGVVTYASGMLGKEPIRSQGHIHTISPSCNASTCEVYEIWEGTACIYMQKSGGDDANDCYAVYGHSGDVIVVPPGWVHATINADPDSNMTFGAWCIRDYGFDYTEVRRHHGIAFFPYVDSNRLIWERNKNYTTGTLIEKNARVCSEFSINPNIAIYTQYENNRSAFDFVTNPVKYSDIWDKYIP